MPRLRVDSRREGKAGGHSHESGHLPMSLAASPPGRCHGNCEQEHEQPEPGETEKPCSQVVTLNATNKPEHSGGHHDESQGKPVSAPAPQPGPLELKPRRTEVAMRVPLGGRSPRSDGVLVVRHSEEGTAGLNCWERHIVSGSRADARATVRRRMASSKWPVDTFAGRVALVVSLLLVAVGGFVIKTGQAQGPWWGYGLILGGMFLAGAFRALFLRGYFGNKSQE